MIPPLSIPVDVVRGHYGDEITTFQTQIRPDQIVQVLGHDPRSKNWKNLPRELREVYENIQRPTTKQRREGTSQYIEDRLGPNATMIGAFPAICIGMTRTAVFEPEREGGIVGKLHLELSTTNRRLMLDGLARVAGALDLMEENPDANVGDWFSFAVTLYSPTTTPMNLGQLGQLFYDFNFLQTPITATHAIALDQSDLYVQLANQLGESATVKRYGGMERRAASLGAKSTAIVVQRVLLRFVRGAAEGRRFQESNLIRVPNPNLTREGALGLRRELEEFISDLATNMGDNRFKDKDSLHLSAPGWQVLGLVFHDLKFKLGDRLTAKIREEVMRHLADIDWSRYNPDWIGMLGEPERDSVTQEEITDSAGRRRVALSRAGRTTIAVLHRYVRQKTGIDQHLLEDEKVLIESAEEEVA